MNYNYKYANKKVKGMISGEFSVGKAEAEADAARDLDDFYED